VAEITEDAMQGKIDFKESFKRRMMLLKGMDESVLEVCVCVCVCNCVYVCVCVRERERVLSGA